MRPSTTTPPWGFAATSDSRVFSDAYLGWDRGMRTARGLTPELKGSQPRADCRHKLVHAMPERIANRQAISRLVVPHDRIDPLARRVFVVEGDRDDLAGREELEQADLVLNGRHRPSDDVPPEISGLPGGGVLQDHHLGLCRHEDRSRAGHVRGVADAPLAFDDDDLRLRLRVRARDFPLELPHDEIAADRVDRDAVVRALEEPRLPRRDERCGNPRAIQLVSQKERGRTL